MFEREQFIADCRAACQATHQSARCVKSLHAPSPSRMPCCANWASRRKARHTEIVFSARAHNFGSSAETVGSSG